MKFTQEPPELENQYVSDPVLEKYLKLYLPEKYFNDITKDLHQLGERTLSDIYLAGRDASDNEPVLHQFDAWGNRVDEVEVADGWNQLKTIAAEEGLISIGYARDYGEFSRIYQMAKLLLYTPSSAIFTCPLAMADGAARLIEQYSPDKLIEPFNHLTSRHSAYFWTAGQWMTEKEGGSDVSQSSTIARHVDGDHYKLYGDKWFTSAITSEMAMTLARIENDAGETTAGNRGLSLFYLRIRDDDGKLNYIKINKLKDKLGTRALPTAELTLEGSDAILIGEIGRGVKQITTILNLTRIYNAVSSIAYMHRGLNLVKDYAKKRSAFGKKIQDLPLHQQVMTDMEIEYITSFVLVFYCVELLGKVETDNASDGDDAILRLMTPLIKLYTGKKAVEFMSEVVESFGGMGYIEETDIPELFRDSQVFPIWEGTTNVLSLDVLRAMAKENSLTALLKELSGFIGNYSGEIDLNDFQDALKIVKDYAQNLSTVDSELQQLAARKFAFTLARLIIVYRLTVFIDDLNNQEDHSFAKKIKLILQRVIRNGIVDVVPLDQSELIENQTILGLNSTD